MHLDTWTATARRGLITHRPRDPRARWLSIQRRADSPAYWLCVGETPRAAYLTLAGAIRAADAIDQRAATTHKGA